MKQNHTKKLAIAAVFVAIAVVGSTLSFPIFGSKCAPVQHMVNVLSAIFLGPWWALSAAFCASLLRNLMGLGTILAFPGSMCGAFLSGILYKYTRKLMGAYVGEVFGTAVIGGMLAYPIASLILGNSAAALFTFVVPFLISTAGGTIVAAVITIALKKSRFIDKMNRELN